MSALPALLGNEGETVVELLLLTADPHPASVLPVLRLLPHAVRVAAPRVTAVLGPGRRDAVLVDARTDLVAARSLCRRLGCVGLEAPVAAVVTERGLVAVSGDWTVEAILLADAGAAEIDARLRLLRARRALGSRRDDALVLGELVMDEAAYSVRLRGRLLELTFKEFELLRYLAHHAGQVFTRRQLLQDVWGYDFVGDVRTVDVHVRRLRAKFGTEHEHMIGTVRNVGYTLVRAQAHETGVGVIVVSGATGTVSNRQPDDLANFAHNDPNDRHPAAGATIHVGGAHRSHLLLPTTPD